MARQRFSRDSGTMRRPMPTQWLVGNFKPLERASLDLASLVVIAGANSSGKSSLFQSLLLLAQSVTDDEPVLNGPLVGLGTPHDVLRDGHTTLTFGCRVSVPAYTAEAALSPEAQSTLVCADLELGYQVDGEDLRLVSVHVKADNELALEATRVPSSQLPAGFYPHLTQWSLGEDVLRVTELQGTRAPRQTFLAAGGLFPEAVLHRRSVRQLLSDYRDAFRYSDMNAKAASQILAFERELRRLWDHLPQAAQVPAVGSGARQLRNQVLAMGEDEFDALLTAMAEVAQWSLEPLRLRRVGGISRGISLESQVANESLRAAAYYLSVGLAGLQELAGSLRYLGPLREAPRLVSPLGQGTRATPVGVSGEYTADFLARGRARIIRFTRPEGEQTETPLLEAVSEWVTYLGVGSRVLVEDRGKLGRSLRLEVDGRHRDLTAVGVGASQLLPVVTLLLGAPPGSVVMLEQPELHLHPAVQSRLADFLLSARRDMKIVVETHSEYLVSRLRLRTAENQADPDRLAILFLRRYDGVTDVKRLVLGPLGDLDEWPAGFFDAADRDAAELVRAVHARLN